MKTILLVDDEYALVENLAEMLQDEGYRVVTAGNGEDGFDRFRADSPDLVVTDFMMPIASGAVLVRRIRDVPGGRGVPVIMMSATTRDVALEADGIPVTVSRFLPKPATWDQLFDAIVDLIGPGQQHPRHQGS